MSDGTPQRICASFVPTNSADTHSKQKMQLELHAEVSRLDNLHSFFVSKVLLDSGATISAISQDFVVANSIPMERLERPIRVTNADGTPNIHGFVTDIVTIRLRILDHEERVTLQVSKLQDHDIFLGFDWFTKHNPFIDWTTR